MAARVTVVAAMLLLGPALRADASLRGTVRDATGAAIADAHLVAARPAGAAPCETTSAADGTFTLDCASPADVIRIEAPSGDAGEVALQVRGTFDARDVAGIKDRANVPAGPVTAFGTPPEADTCLIT